MSLRKRIGKTLRNKAFQEKALHIAIQILITVHNRIRGRWLM